MFNCEACGKEVDFPYTCKYCLGFFCSGHQLPESHKCTKKPTIPSSPITSLTSAKLAKVKSVPRLSKGKPLMTNSEQRIVTNSERQIAKLEGISSSSHNTHYDLYLTNNRMIFIKSFKAKYGVVAVGRLGSVINEAIFYFQGRNAKKKEEKIQNMTLDEKLQQAKGCFAIAYEDIREIEMREGGHSEIDVNLVSSRVKHFWAEKSQIEELNSALTSVTTLQGKIHLFK